MRRIFVVLAVAALGLSLFIGTAVAGKKKNTTVVFNSGSPSVSGKNVKAKGSLKTASACLVARGIKLFQTDASGNVLATLDSKSTDQNGNWNVSGQIPSSVPANTVFYVQVKATKRAVGKFVCKAGLSPVIQLTSK
jgi:hypothetical protein